MKLLNNERLILASKSPRRQELLEQVGLKIKISPSHIDEGKIKQSSPNDYVKELAFLKANKMSQKYVPDSAISSQNFTDCGFDTF